MLSFMMCMQFISDVIIKSVIILM